MFTNVSSAILLTSTLVVNGAQQSTFLTPHINYHVPELLECPRVNELSRVIK